LQSLRRHGQLTEIELSSLDETHTQQLATSVIGTKPGLEVAGRLYQETEGNPLYVVETLRASFLTGSNGKGVNEPFNWASMSFSPPPSVKATIHDRMASLSPIAQEVANLAAVIGKCFSYEVIKTASGMDEASLADALDELQRRILCEKHDAYHFTHNKIREVVYTSLSIARQKYLENKITAAAGKSR
jgi:predicted ATPase